MLNTIEQIIAAQKMHEKGYRTDHNDTNLRNDGQYWMIKLENPNDKILITKYGEVYSYPLQVKREL